MTSTSAPSHIANGDGAQQGHARGDARGSSRTRARSHREAHVCELFDEPVHDPGLVLLAGRLHALLESLLGGVPPGAAGGGAFLGGGVAPHASFFVFPLTGAEAHVVPTTAPAFLHRF